MERAPDPSWRQTLVEIEALRQRYDELNRTGGASEAELDLLWLRLWLAERRRDELLKGSE